MQPHGSARGVQPPQIQTFKQKQARPSIYVYYYYVCQDQSCQATPHNASHESLAWKMNGRPHETGKHCVYLYIIDLIFVSHHYYACQDKSCHVAPHNASHESIAWKMNGRPHPMKNKKKEMKMHSTRLGDIAETRQQESPPPPAGKPCVLVRKFKVNCSRESICKSSEQTPRTLR